MSQKSKRSDTRKATTPELKEIAIKEGFRTMSDMGRELILSGDLNLESLIEFYRWNNFYVIRNFLL